MVLAVFGCVKVVEKWEVVFFVKVICSYTLVKPIEGYEAETEVSEPSEGKKANCYGTCIRSCKVRFQRKSGDRKEMRGHQNNKLAQR